MDEDEIHNCMTLMKLMAKNTPLIELQKIQDLAYNIAEYFKPLCEIGLTESKCFFFAEN